MIKNLLQSLKGGKKVKSDFSTFFREASREQKEKLLLEVAHEANQDQRQILERYDKLQAKNTS
ncbi:hypothetical protein HY623_00920 [Candidatus Uhrbacteria bacterium]|nr:hypothetical protein [Candidatus Uhrbacteria bacterium]